MKRRLDDAATRSGRSQSQEAEFRLERSFDRSDLLSEALRLEYGRVLAGILMLLGAGMLWADTFHQMDKEKPRGNKPWRWGTNPSAYGEAMEAATVILRALRPQAKPDQPSGLGIDVARQLLKAVRDGSGTGFTDNIDEIRDLLEPVIGRMVGAINE